MASVSTQKATGLRRVIFNMPDDRRVALHVGKLSKAAAREIGLHVDHLVACKRSGADVRLSTTEWVERIRQEWPRLARRLHDLQLVREPRTARGDPLFADFVDALINGRSNVKPNTIKAWRQTACKIRQFFGYRSVQSLTTKDGTAFLRWLCAPVALGGAGHTGSTPGKHLNFARGFLNDAVDGEILSVNPFSRVRVARAPDSTRRQFVSDETVRRVMESTDDQELRTIVAFSRWGGLRTPSESFALQWQHIHWNEQRITIPGVKTKQRQIPMFPELLSHLQSLVLQSSNTDGGYLFPGPRQFTGANLRRRMTRLVTAAGLPVWPKIFHNLRSSRQTELEERFPRKTVCEWMGNSETIADQHYLQVRDEHFERAANQLPLP
jgi:site-specific recombinase XerD